MIILANAFSLNMLDTTEPCSVMIQPLSLEAVSKMISEGFTSAIGHASTAAVLTDMLSVGVAMQRTTVKLDLATKLIVAQFKGERLAEGSTTLPAGATIEWLLVTLT